MSFTWKKGIIDWSHWNASISNFLKQKKYIAILLNLSETREVNVKVFVFFTSAEFQVFFKVIHLYKMHFGNMKRLFFYKHSLTLYRLYQRNFNCTITSLSLTPDLQQYDQIWNTYIEQYHCYQYKVLGIVKITRIWFCKEYIIW